MIGLLTFTGSDNYGALLQAYALQTSVRKLGAECEFLDFSSKRTVIRETDLSRLPPVMRKRIEETVMHQKKRAALFEDFRGSHLILSAPISDAETPMLDSRYERFIVGSDQVWNAGITGGDLRYALSFAAPEKRFSYAASFGGEDGIGRADEPFWKELAAFSRISLREQTGMETVREKTGKTPTISVDPSFLLSGEEWRSFIADEPTAGTDYVLLFLIEYDPQFAALAKEWAENHHKKLIVVCASYIPQFGFDAYSGVGVKAWLRLIRDASCVFCDSFHATVFSILFEKAFMPNLSKAKLANRSSRLGELLERLGLSSDSVNEFTDDPRIRSILFEESQKGIQYLKEIVR